MNKAVNTSNRVVTRLVKVFKGQKDAPFTAASQLKQKVYILLSNFKLLDRYF